MIKLSNRKLFLANFKKAINWVMSEPAFAEVHVILSGKMAYTELKSDSTLIWGIQLLLQQIQFGHRFDDGKMTFIKLI